MEKHGKRTPIKHRRDHNSPENPKTEVSSGRSSHDGGRRNRRAEPDGGESGSSIPLTGPIPANQTNVTSHGDADSEMQPPSSQPTASSPAKHQAQSDTSPPSVPIKERNNITSEGDTNSQHRETREENEGLRREQQAKEHRAHEETLRKEHEAKEREKEERWKASIQRKKRELEDLKLQVAAATTKYQGLAEINRQIKDELNGLNSEWNHDLQLLESQRQVLNASRSFAAREGTLDAATLIQSFNDMNSLIGDFSFEVLRGLDEKADTRPLEANDYKLLCNAITDPNLKFFVEQIAHRDLKASDVVDPIVTGILVADLTSKIFRPFAPGLDNNRSNVLKRMYRKMQESEPQARSARWRSITYTHAVSNPEPQFLEQAANRSVSNVMGVLTALSGGIELKPTEEYYELALRIFEAAVKVQDRAKKEYVSFDYNVYAVPAKTKYDKLEMDISQAGNEDPAQVWITIGLGMKAQRSIQGEGGLLNVECSIPVKPMVICDNWDHNA